MCKVDPKTCLFKTEWHYSVNERFLWNCSKTTQSAAQRKQHHQQKQRQQHHQQKATAKATATAKKNKRQTIRIRKMRLRSSRIIDTSDAEASAENEKKTGDDQENVAENLPRDDEQPIVKSAGSARSVAWVIGAGPNAVKDTDPDVKKTMGEEKRRKESGDSIMRAKLAKWKSSRGKKTDKEDGSCKQEGAPPAPSNGALVVISPPRHGREKKERQRAPKGKPFALADVGLKSEMFPMTFSPGFKRRSREEKGASTRTSQLRRSSAARQLESARMDLSVLENAFKAKVAGIEAERDAAQATAAQLEDIVRDLREEKESLKKETSSVRASLGDCQQCLLAAEKERDGLRAKAEQSAADIAKLRQNCAKEEKNAAAQKASGTLEQQKLSHALASANEELERLKSSISGMELENQELKQQLATTQSKEAALQEKMENLQLSWQEKLDAAVSAERETVRQLRGQLSESLDIVRHQLKESKRVQSMLKTLEKHHAKEMEKTKENSKKERVDLEEENHFLKSEMAEIQGEFARIEEDARSQEAEREDALKKNRDLESRMGRLVTKVRTAEVTRRKLHDEVMELRGNIRVVCRVRPRIAHDGSEEDESGCRYTFPDADLEQRSLELLRTSSSSLSTDGLLKKYKFQFDHVFGPKTTQSQVYEEVSQMVQSAVDGFRVCIFAYGQTGSGKTHTMLGPLMPTEIAVHGGIIPRACEHIFQYCSELEDQGWEFSVRASMLEIYNETIRDLLVPAAKAGREKHEIHHIRKPKRTEDGSSGAFVWETQVTGLHESAVDSADEALRLLQAATAKRSTSATRCNAASSRSHTVFTMKIRGKDSKTGQIREGQLHLVDLAGSERLARSCSNEDPKLLSEAKAINKSLSSLGNVISALSNKQAHVPYRDSKLTYLLQQSLGGNCKALMFANIAPPSMATNESLCTLRFAQKVNKCERAQASSR